MDKTVASTAEKVSRFELAPPRRFILPAILLLLSERPGYGYGLVPRLAEFRFGHVDRPAVYRALAQLERDGLVTASSQSPTAGQARRVYRVTPLGERVLRSWMGVVKEEHEHLGRVLRRYQATGTTEAVLAEVEGGWGSVLHSSWSPVSSTSDAWRRLVPLDTDCPETGATDEAGGSQAAEPGPRTTPGHFRLVSERSVILIEVRSTVGPLSFGAVGVSGSVSTALSNGTVDLGGDTSGRVEVDITGLRSGNRLYDAELLRRVDARRFPTAAVNLKQCILTGPGSRYLLEGDVTFHGVTRPAQGTVTLEAISQRRLVVTGEQVFDIRDFAVPSPTVLMLRIYPDVRVRLHAEAELEDMT